MPQDFLFGEFCEYILPYRSLAGYPDCFSGAELCDLFGKYAGAGARGFAGRLRSEYNRSRRILGGVTGKRSALISSLYRPFFPGRECTDVAVIGCQILRACGLPVMVEFCNAYRDFPGRHFYCTVRTTGDVGGPSLIRRPPCPVRVNRYQWSR